MKVIPTRSYDTAEITQNMSILSDKIKELEEELRAGYKIKGLSVNDIIFNHLKKLNLAKPTSMNKSLPRKDIFSVSQCSYDCYRKLYFEMQCPKPTTNEDSLGRFALGDMIDSMMKEAFESIGAKTDVGCGKPYFNEQFKIQGSTDAEFSDLIIEIKSVSPFAWKYIEGGKDKFGNIIIGQPKIQHVRQLNSYLDIKDIEDGVLIYINKDNFQLKPYPVKHSRILMTQTIGRCAIVYRAIMDGTVPTKVKGDECSYCGHKDVCRGDKNVNR